MGRFLKEGPLGPGTVVIYDKIDELKTKVDIRETPYKSYPLELETADKVAIEVIALCFYMIYQPAKVINITNYDARKFIESKSISLLREAVLGLNLSEILTNKEKIELHMKDDIEKESLKVGVKVTRVEILNIKVIDPDRLKGLLIFFSKISTSCTQLILVYR